MNAMLYFSVVLIWGTTWIAITAQHGEFSPVIGVFWRFAIASFILFFILILSKRLQALSLEDHLFCILQGLCVFGLNFICFYSAVAYMNSGLESVIFSMAVLFNAVNSHLFFKQKVTKTFVPAAICGIVGICALFWHDIISTDLHWQTLWAVGLCMLGTYGFSLGNMISLRHQRRHKDIFTTNAYGMLYGAMVMALLGLGLKQDFLPSISLQALIALFYLAIAGSVIGFTLYFILIGRIGAGQAAYSTLLFPLVALIISTIWENYHWHFSSVLGIAFILLGNWILFTQPSWLLKYLGKSRQKSCSDM
ncbi:DMT family transporter [Acinetobacter stercoris]|uniref:Putative inner membrane transporter YhbE n=1 Tax=Acinetobacter stercoris TaxID=2126983 RepID=A0A2U3MVQ0_9GAMM|nr:DMT family transporter [Acinetobacter stercoris]SPL69455.1 putative inner membrane transporter YhbE [Acinetobacter stercoris]